MSLMPVYWLGEQSSKNSAIEIFSTGTVNVGSDSLDDSTIALLDVLQFEGYSLALLCLHSLPLFDYERITAFTTHVASLSSRGIVEPDWLIYLDAALARIT